MHVTVDVLNNVRGIADTAKGQVELSPAGYKLSDCETELITKYLEANVRALNQEQNDSDSLCSEEPAAFRGCTALCLV